jgi:hypothetical protein
MTQQNPPDWNFSNIIYNPQFYDNPNDSLTQTLADQRYLQRIGAPTSLATTTTFNNAIIANDITVNNLPITNTTTTLINSNNLMPKYYIDSNYGKLSIGNNWTASNIFSNGFSAAGIISITGSMNCTTGSIRVLTQTNTNNSTFAASTEYVQNQNYTTLALVQSNNNIFSNIQTFNGSLTIPTASTTSYLLPYGRDTGSYRLGLNSSQNNTVGTNNIAFGTNALQCTTTLGTSYVNKISNNIAIGNNSGYKLTSDINNTWSSDDNIIIGHNTCSTTFFNSVRNVILGNNSGKNNILQDTVIIGDSACSNGPFQITKSVIIGSQCLKNVSDKSLITVVGYGNGVNMSGNSLTIYGANNCISALNNNSGVVLGTNSANNVNSNAGSIFIGSNCGNSLIAGTLGGFCVFIGQNADTTLATAYNSLALGYTASIQNDFEAVIGGLCNNGTKIGYPKLCIPTKNYLYCNQSISTNTTLTFRSAENVLITSSSVSSITLPIPTGNTYDNQGATFLLIKSFSGTSTININAPTGQTIFYNNTTYSTFTMGTNISYMKLTCVNINGSSWAITNIDPKYIDLSGYLTTSIASSTYQTIADMTNYLTIVDASSTYQTQADMATYYNTGTSSIDGLSSINPTSGATLEIGNTSTTDLKGSTLINSCYKLNGHSLLSGTSTLSLPLSEHYILTTSSVGTVNLPVITSAMYGSEISFTKINATNSYTINAGLGNTFRLLGSSSSATQTSIIMSSNFTVLKIVATQSTVWNVLISNNYEKINTSLISTNISLVFPYSENYQIATPNTTTITITIPTATSDLLGVKILFRRVNTIMAQINCNSINDLTNSTTTVLLSTTQYTCEIVCLVNSATPTYGWFIIRQN